MSIFSRFYDRVFGRNRSAEALAMMKRLKEMETQFPPKTAMGQALNDLEVSYVSRGACPDCGGTRFRRDLVGVQSTNWTCSNETCGSEFNLMNDHKNVKLGSRTSEPRPKSIKIPRREFARSSKKEGA